MAAAKFVGWFRLYYARIGIGSPSTNYYVQVDTGSDILWVNCIGCEKCPKKSNLGVRLSILTVSFTGSIMVFPFVFRVIAEYYLHFHMFWSAASPIMFAGLC